VQLLRALKYIHSANVLHRDLKPSNVLIDCEIKVCDFGLARTDSQVGLMTEYVTTRWYKAPELLISQDTYDTAVDMWAAGCILAEVLLRRPLFTGKNAIDQLDTKIRVRGSMSEEELELVQIERARKHIKSLPYSPKSKFTQIFEGRNPAAADLVSKLLVYDPRKRLTAKVRDRSFTVLNHLKSCLSCMVMQDGDPDVALLRTLTTRTLCAGSARAPIL
jgi:serine/threonine protein kinase